jgi:hypothetical protein
MEKVALPLLCSSSAAGGGRLGEEEEGNTGWRQEGEREWREGHMRHFNSSLFSTFEHFKCLQNETEGV